jgi:simple sugar transport system permease protein
MRRLMARIWWFLHRTRAGLILRAVGEIHASAHALGHRVLRIRTLAVLFGGGCASAAPICRSPTRRSSSPA